MTTHDDLRCATCGRYPGDAPLARLNERGCMDCGMQLFGAPDLPGPALLTTTVEHLAEFKPNVLNVHADVSELLEHFGDEARLFDFLGKLKDLLA